MISKQELLISLLRNNPERWFHFDELKVFLKIVESNAVSQLVKHVRTKGVGVERFRNRVKLVE